MHKWPSCTATARLACSTPTWHRSAICRRCSTARPGAWPPRRTDAMTALIFEQFLSTPEIGAIFSDAAIVQGMLDFEAALARAQADEGVIPAHAAPAIVDACRVEHDALASLIAAGSVAGTLAIPLVKQLTARVAATDAHAAGYVH